MGVAAKMMAKMGWTEGRGLGRSQQGITTPLMAQKKDGRSGVIINADSAHSGEYWSEGAVIPVDVHVDGRSLYTRWTGSAGHQDKRARTIRGSPSKVILLRNMVGPGEVDDDLEDEVRITSTGAMPASVITLFDLSHTITHSLCLMFLCRVG